MIFFLRLFLHQSLIQNKIIICLYQTINTLKLILNRFRFFFGLITFYIIFRFLIIFCSQEMKRSRFLLYLISSTTVISRFKILRNYFIKGNKNLMLRKLVFKSPGPSTALTSFQLNSKSSSKIASGSHHRLPLLAWRAFFTFLDNNKDEDYCRDTPKQINHLCMILARRRNVVLLRCHTFCIIMQLDLCTNK